MSRVIKLAGLTAFTVLVIAAKAQAATILVSDTYDWGGVGAGVTFTEPAFPNWSHTLTFSPAAASFNYAKLDLRHVGNVGNRNELWFLSTQGNVFIGNLSGSGNSHDLTSAEAQLQTFDLPSSLYPVFPASGAWTLALKLGEGTGSDNDQITLDYATLRVSYESVSNGPVTSPEPATLLLFGTGVAALARQYRRRQRQRVQ